MTSGENRAELAATAWRLMNDFVESNKRNGRLRDALKLGRGSRRVLVLLSLDQGPKSIGALAEQVGADPPYVTLVVNELEARGMLTRAPDPEDRRRKLVELTDTGQQAVGIAQAIIAEPPPALLDSLTEAELEQLTALLGRIDPKR